jgi:hypothetical protein
VHLDPVGDLLNAGIAGNIADDLVGSMEFACKVSGAKLVLVMGHTSCGAIKGAGDQVQLGNLTGLLEKAQPAVQVARVVSGERNSKNKEYPRTHDQIGPTLAMNITSTVRNTDHYFLYDEVFDAVHALGGLTGYAHANSGMFHVHSDMSLNVPRQKLDFVEILQFNQLGTGLDFTMSFSTFPGGLIAAPQDETSFCFNRAAVRRAAFGRQEGRRDREALWRLVS